jgi:uncharacterized protein (TIGR03435 family)
VRQLLLAVTLLALVLSSRRLAGQSIEFETASLQRHTSDAQAAAAMTFGKGEARLIDVSMRTLVALAFPLDASTQIADVPSWADSERYDLVAKGKADASTQEMQQMVRALLERRASLATHFEPRDRESYNLVLARDDGQLGPGLAPSTLDCSTPPSNRLTSAGPASTDLKTQVMNRCNVMFTDPFDQTSYAGGARMELLVGMVAIAAGRPVVDRTGLTGFYSVKVRFQHSAVDLPSVASPDAPPSVFTALPEQLGLKLEPDHMQVQTLVIDRLERPSDN